MNSRLRFAFLIFSLCATALMLPSCTSQDLERFTFDHLQMGTTFKIILYAPDQEIAQEAADSAFKKIDELNFILSDYLENSELNNLARTSGMDSAMVAGDELFFVISEAQTVSQKTEGAFDITIGPYVQLWREMNRQSEYGEVELPDSSVLQKASVSVGFQHIELDSVEKTITLNQPNMRLDLGGIAKGYAADEALKVLESFNISSALVDAGGDITTGNAPPNRDGWHVTIPVQTPEGEMSFDTFSLANQAIASSGDLFQFVEIDGVRYSHIINPKTGLGLTDQSMVTVIAKNGITADSYASALSVIGAEKGSQFLSSEPNLLARFVYHKDGEFTHLESPEFKSFKISESEKDH